MKKCHLLRNKAKLKSLDKEKLDLDETPIYANFSLCPEYRKLWYNSKKLFLAKHIHAFWVSNGAVKIKIEEDDDPCLIEHQSDLVKRFPHFDFTAPIVVQKEVKKKKSRR